MTTDIRIVASGFAALKQQADEVSRQNQQSATTKEQETKLRPALENTKAVSNAIAAGADPMRAQEQQAGATGQSTAAPSQNNAAGERTSSRNSSSRRRRSDVPTTSLTRELAANGEPPGGVVAVQITVPSTFDPLNPTVLVGPPGVASNESIGAVASLQRLISKAKPPGYGTAYAETSGILLEWILLPITKDTCIVLRVNTQIAAWYHFEVTAEAFNLLDSDLVSLWQAHAFVVSTTKARQINVPSLLENNLKDLYPEMELNDTIQYTGAPFFYPTIPPYPIDIFRTSIWRNSSRYGDYASNFDTLPRQFGMGNLTSGHRATFTLNGYYSPAVYRFLTGPMTINAQSRFYDHMRTDYYSNAPTYYIGPCQKVPSTCTTEKVTFDVSREVPVDIFTGLDPAGFRRESAYDVKLNGADPTRLWYAWNWDNPSFCKKRLRELGFNAEDLKP